MNVMWGVKARIVSAASKISRISKRIVVSRVRILYALLYSEVATFSYLAINSIFYLDPSNLGLRSQRVVAPARLVNYVPRNKSYGWIFVGRNSEIAHCTHHVYKAGTAPTTV